MINKTLFSSFFFILLAFSAPQTFAAATTMGFTPQSGSFGKPFTAKLVIDGHGEKFNAAGATIALPSQLKIQDIELGDCHFSFLTTPTIQNPSFEGVILSSYSQKCTAYSLTLVPVKKGKADITISKASIKRYGDAAEILSKKYNASYIITGTSDISSVLGEQTKDIKGYTVNLSLSAENKPVTTAIVKLASVDKKTPAEGKTDAEGSVTFSNLKEGIYDVVVEQNNKKVGESIINVSGSNRILTLGINLDTQKNNPLLKNANNLLTIITASPLLMGGILVVGLALGIIVSLLGVKLFGRKK